MKTLLFSSFISALLKSVYKKLVHSFVIVWEINVFLI